MKLNTIHLLPLAVLSTFNLISIFPVMSIPFLKGLKNDKHPRKPRGGAPVPDILGKLYFNGCLIHKTWDYLWAIVHLKAHWRIKTGHGLSLYNLWELVCFLSSSDTPTSLLLMINQVILFPVPWLYLDKLVFQCFLWSAVFGTTPWVFCLSICNVVGTHTRDMSSGGWMGDVSEHVNWASFYCTTDWKSLHFCVKYMCLSSSRKV